MKMQSRAIKKTVIVVAIVITIIITVIFGLYAVIIILFFSQSNQGGNNKQEVLGRELSKLTVPSACVSNGDPLYIPGSISNVARYERGYSCDTRLGISLDQITRSMASAGYSMSSDFPEPLYTRYDKRYGLWYENSDFRVDYSLRLDLEYLVERHDDLPDSARVMSVYLSISPR